VFLAANLMHKTSSHQVRFDNHVFNLPAQNNDNGIIFTCHVNLSCCLFNLGANC